jgi:hypothetical protein
VKKSCICSDCQKPSAPEDSYCSACGNALWEETADNLPLHYKQTVQRLERKLSRSNPHLFPLLSKTRPFYAAFGIYLGLSLLYAVLAKIQLPVLAYLYPLLGFVEIALPLWASFYLRHPKHQYLVWGILVLIAWFKII